MARPKKDALIDLGDADVVVVAGFGSRWRAHAGNQEQAWPLFNVVFDSALFRQRACHQGLRHRNEAA